MSAPRTLVAGAAVGYTPQQIAPFLESLRTAGYRGDVLLIVERADLRRFRRLPLFSGVILLPGRQWLPFRPWLQQRQRMQRWLWHPLQKLLWHAVRQLWRLPLNEEQRILWLAPLAARLYAPTEYRFLRFWLYLREHRYDRVLLSDVRDVLFQADPFTQFPASGLAVGMESREYSIATQRWNADRTREIYGPQMLARIGSRAVSCSGVTAGDYQAMMRYLLGMTREMLGLNRLMARRGWLDQALHNVVLWDRWDDGVIHELDTLASPLATLGGFSNEPPQPAPEGRLRNRDGSLPAILHQYDRLGPLADSLRQRLCTQPGGMPS